MKMEDVRASLSSGGVIPDMVVIIIQRSLHDLRRLFHEVQELWRGKYARSFLLRQI